MQIAASSRDEHYFVFRIASAMRAASTAGRTLCVRTMEAPWRMAATSAAMLAVSRAAMGAGWSGVERREGVAEEEFAAESGEKRAAQCEQLRLSCKEQEVLIELFAEAVAGVEYDAIRRDSGAGRRGEAGGKA